MIRIAINGFGRIGRLAFRQIYNSKDIEVVAINDLSDTKVLSHLLKYDTMQGSFMKEKIDYTEDDLIVDGKSIHVYKESNPENLPWRELNVDIVFECTGLFTSKEKSMKHILAGARKVIISAPATEDVKTIVYNVNHNELNGEEQIISCASCTTNCLAPIAKVLNDNFKIKIGFMSTIHAYTNDQNTLDAPHKKGDLRRARAAAENIVPNSTGAAKAIGLVLPELKGKLDGSAIRVPVASGSIIELTCLLENDVTKEDIDKAMRHASNETLGFIDEEIVSSDIIGMKFGALYDSTLTKIVENNGTKIVKVSAWYDNEMSYTCQMIRTAKYLINLIK